MTPLRQTNSKYCTRVNYSRVREILNTTCFGNLYSENVHTECQNIIDCITQAIEKSRYNSKHNYDYAICPWMNDSILLLIKKKDYFYNKLKHNKANKYYRGQFKFFRNKSVMLIRKAKKNYYTNLIKRQNGDGRQIWRIVRDVVGLEDKRYVTPENVSVQTANDFNDHFSRIGVNIYSLP